MILNVGIPVNLEMDLFIFHISVSFSGGHLRQDVDRFDQFDYLGISKDQFLPLFALLFNS